MTLKERWALCERISIILGARKDRVYSSLSTFQNENLVEPVLNNDPQAIQTAKEIIEKIYSFVDSAKTISTVVTTTVVHQPPQNEFESRANDHKIMLWAVTRIGDPIRALEAFEGVIKALNPQ
jgi:hypothetical protein